MLALESTLDRIRRGELEVNDEVVEQLLKACAHIGVLLAQATERVSAEQMNCSRLREFMREIDAMTTLQAWLRKVRYKACIAIARADSKHRFEIEGRTPCWQI